MSYVDETCPVCWDEYTTKNGVYILACGHGLCDSCSNMMIKTMAEPTITCPLCRCTHICVHNKVTLFLAIKEAFVKYNMLFIFTLYAFLTFMTYYSYMYRSIKFDHILMYIQVPCDLYILLSLIYYVVNAMREHGYEYEMEERSIRIAGILLEID